MAEPAASSALVLEPRKHGDQSLVAEVRTLRSVDVDFREHRFADEAFADGFGEMAGEADVVEVLLVDPDDDGSALACCT